MEWRITNLRSYLVSFKASSKKAIYLLLQLGIASNSDFITYFMQFYILSGLLTAALVVAKTSHIYVATRDLDSSQKSWGSLSYFWVSKPVVGHWGVLFSEHGQYSQHLKQDSTKSFGTLFELDKNEKGIAYLRTSEAFRPRQKEDWRFTYVGMTSVSSKALGAVGKVILWFC